MASAQRNKAYSATVNRLALRYGITAEDGYHGEDDNHNDRSGDGDAGNGAAFDIVGDTFNIAVETTASVADAVERLSEHSGPVYIAMTNREGVDEAVALATGMLIGIMDPQGEIVKPYGADTAGG